MTDPFESLEDVRRQIDHLDQEIVRILAERGGCVAAAARFKRTALEVRAPDRLATMLAERRRWATEHKLDPDFIERVFQMVTSYFISREMKDWSSSTERAAAADSAENG